MAFCPKCGADIGEVTAGFCAVCGSNLETNEKETGFGQAPPPPYPSPPPGYQTPPPGYQQGPPPPYQGPPPGYQAPPPGYQQGPPPPYQGTPPGYQGPPPGYQGIGMYARGPHNEGLFTAAFILMIIVIVIICISGISSLGFGLIPLAWCIPMTVHISKIKKGLAPNTIAFGVCTLLFAGVISGILLLVAPKDV